MLHRGTALPAVAAKRYKHATIHSQVLYSQLIVGGDGLNFAGEAPGDKTKSPEYQLMPQRMSAHWKVCAQKQPVTCLLVEPKACSLVLHLGVG